MNYSIRLISIILMLSLSLMFSGCGNTTQTSQPTITADSAITTDCIVSYFRQGKAPYITSQQYQFDPTDETLLVTANEPASDYTFTLTKKGFTQSKDLTEFLSALPAGFVNQPLAEAIYFGFLAASNVLDTDSLVSGENMKLEGQWFQPLQADWPQADTRIILMKNTSTNRIDTVGITQFDSASITENNEESAPIKTRWLVKGYNFRYNEDLGTLVPRKIDIFDIQNGIASKELIIQIEYRTVQVNMPSMISE